MNTTEHLTNEMLRATTIALRVALGHIEGAYIETARVIMRDILMHDDYRRLSGSQRALFADAGTAIEETAAATKGLKRL